MLIDYFDFDIVAFAMMMMRRYFHFADMPRLMMIFSSP